jgi:adrenodoxin-NADP+ reductase
VLQEELDRGMTASTLQELEGPGSRPKVRINKLLQKCAIASSDASASDGNDNDNATTTKNVAFRFLLNPVEIKLKPSTSTSSTASDPSLRVVGSVVCERTELVGPPHAQRAVGTGVTEEIPADMVLVSIGYQGEPIQGGGKEDDETAILNKALFDYDRGVYRNVHGKVVPVVSSTENDSDGDTNNISNNSDGGLYVAGWLKRGPSGIIGTNINDARDTVATIMDDYQHGRIGSSGSGSDPKPGRAGLQSLLQSKNVPVVDWKMYLNNIDAWETADENKSRSPEQPREKLTSISKMLEVAFASSNKK